MLTGRAGGSNEGERGEKDRRAQSTFDSNAMMEDPLRIAEKEKEQEVYQCSVCQMFFTRKSDLKRHMVCHSDARPYKCTVCEKSFKRSYALASHARLHSGVRHKCDSCDFTTMNKLSLKLHHRRLHQRDFRYQCERCDKCFMSNYELTDHQASHLGARTFACGHCSKAYSQKSHLVAHERLSHGVRRAKSRHFCDLCSKGFISEEALRKHTNRHVMCVQCSKEFPSNHALTQHIRKNSCERPYQCKLCPKAFGKAGMLKVHELLIHENDVPATSADAASCDTAA